MAESQPPGNEALVFRAFWFQYNVILLGGAVAFSIALATSRPLLVAAPLAALASITLFTIVFALTRYVSLASILGAASFPIFAWFTVSGPRPAFFIAVQCIVALLIIVKHHPNIRRLLAGTEHRFGTPKTA